MTIIELEAQYAAIANVVRRLQQKEAEVEIARNEFNEQISRKQAALHNTAQQLGLCITGFTSVPREIEEVQRLIAEDEESRAVVTKKESELRQAIIDASDRRLAGDGRARDKAHSLEQTLGRLYAGTLLCATNKCYPRIHDLDARLTASKDRIERLRAQLAAHLQQAETLLAEPVTR